MVNYHHRLRLTRAFGPSMLPSSDTQRFPTPEEVMGGARTAAWLGAA